MPIPSIFEAGGVFGDMWISLDKVQKLEGTPFEAERIDPRTWSGREPAQRTSISEGYHTIYVSKTTLPGQDIKTPASNGQPQ